jgi:hypothetical protein
VIVRVGVTVLSTVEKSIIGSLSSGLETIVVEEVEQKGEHSAVSRESEQLKEF